MTQPSEPPDGDTPLREVTDWLEIHAQDRNGTHCPACGHKVKIYPRPLTEAWVRVLFKMWSRAGNRRDWVYMAADDIKTKGQDEALMRHWELIEREEGHHRPDGNPRTGWYRITERGEAFMFRGFRVPRRATIFHDHMLGYADDNDLVNAREVVGEFNYDEIVRGL